MPYVFALSIVGLSTALLWTGSQLRKQQGKYKLLQQKFDQANQAWDEQHGDYDVLLAANTNQAQEIVRLEQRLATVQAELLPVKEEAELFADEVGQLEAKMQQLECDRQAQMAVIQSLSEQLAQIQKPPHPDVHEEMIVLDSLEKDLYAQERRAIVVDVLQKALQTMSEETRRKHVLMDIVENNQVDSERDQLAQRIRDIFRTYRKMDRRTAKGLKDIGFEIISDNNHCKIQFAQDERYTFTFAKTPSDARAGKNNASTICRNLL